MKYKIQSLMVMGIILLSGCNPASPASPTLIPTDPVQPTVIFEATATPAFTPIATFTPIPAEAATPIPPVTRNVCTDPKVVAMINTFITAVLTEDGELLGSVVSPDGMEVRYFRDGNAINYLPDQAKFLFETTFEADWGLEPGSGLPKIGSFHDVVVPDLVRIFNQPYTLYCNELRHGGATYELTWPYNKDFYSIHFAGTEANGFLDWHTWVVGVEYINDEPYIYALTQFFWEP